MESRRVLVGEVGDVVNSGAGGEGGDGGERRRQAGDAGTNAGESTRVLVACSGGADSVALTHVLARLAGPFSLTLEVASVDHGLRPESAEELVAVGRFVEDLALPFHAIRLRGLADEAGSRQEVARKARYRALFALARDRGMHAIAVGHTQDDQAETVLARLLRGAGLRGLAAISPAREDGVTRPLIDAKRADVDAWVRGNGLPVLHDPSNDDPRYERVRIRRTLLPLLREENPEIGTHLANLADEARDTSEWVAAEARVRLEAARLEGGLELAALRAAPRPVLLALLARFVQRRTGHPAKRAHLLALADVVHRAPKGSVRLPGGAEARRDGEILRVETHPQKAVRGGTGGASPE